MKLLLDTRYLIWATLFSDRLSNAERDAIASNEVSASAVSLWELRIKWQKLRADGSRKAPADPQDVLGALELLGIPCLPLDAATACASQSSPIDHSDPFDEQLLVHAEIIGARLLARDAELVRHPLAYQAG